MTNLTKSFFNNDVSPLLKLATPLILNSLVHCAVFFFETIFLAHLGSDILAAGALVNWLFATIAVIVFGTLGSISILVSHKHGAKDDESIAQIARDGLVQAVLLTIPIYFLVVNMAPVFILLGQPESVAIYAKQYLHALSWGIIANFLWIACLDVVIGLGHTRAILVFSIITVISEITSSYILIFGKLGFPKLGIAGAGWGTTIGNWITLITVLVYILSQKQYRFYFRHVFTFTKPIYLRELFELGAPIGVMSFVEVAFFFVLSLSMGTMGTTVLASNQVVLQYLGLMMSAMFALAQAVTVRMGHLIGANEYSSAARVNYIGMGLASLLMLVIAVAYWCYPETLISVDFDIQNPNNTEIVKLITSLMSICAIFQIIEANRILSFGSLRALKDTKFTMVISILSFWGIALPIGYLISTKLSAGAPGYWWAMVLGASISVLLLQWRYQNRINRMLHRKAESV